MTCVTKQWDQITVKELFLKSKEESKECLELAKEALQRKDQLSFMALKDRSDRHNDLYEEIMFFVNRINLNPDVVTVRMLLDEIERDRVACLQLESKAFKKGQRLPEQALRRQGNNYEILYQRIMFFVNKIVPI